MPALPRRRTAHTHGAHARRASRTRTTCWSATCGCAPGSRTWNGRCATRSTRTPKSQHSANDAIRHVTIARDVSAGAARGLRRAARMEGRRSRRPRRISRRSAITSRASCRRPCNVPQGLINSSWGGTRIETWMSDAGAAHARRQRRQARLVRRVRTDHRASRRAHWGESWQKWWTAQRATGGTQPWAVGVTRPAHGNRRRRELAHWENWGVPAARPRTTA